MKKLLIMASLFWPQKNSGGPPISIMNLVQSIKDNFDIYIISKNHEINDYKALEGIHPGWNQFDFGKAFYTSKGEHTFKIITRLIQDVEPDVIYQNSFFSIDDLFPVLAYKKKNRNVKVIVAPRGEFYPERLQVGKLKKKVYGNLFRYSGLLKDVYFQGTGQEECMQEKTFLGIPDDHLMNIQNISLPVNELHDSIEKRPNELKLVYTARIHPTKNTLKAIDEPFTVNDRSTELELLYIDDLVEGMFDLLEGKEQHCEFDGVETVADANGRYCYVPVTHKVSLGEIVDLLQEFKQQPQTLLMPKMPNGSFAKKLYSLYLTYLPKEKFKYAMKMNVDDRGSFTELVHTADCGQVSINISKPGITKGQHWHNSKWELFIVVHGHGLIQERNINTGEMVEFEVNGDKVEAVHMIPGWTHNIINLSDTEDLVTVMTCNEVFDPDNPDTFFEVV